MRTRILSEKFKNSYKKQKEYFTRKRILGFSELIVFQLTTVGKTLRLELRGFLKEMQAKKADYSKQAYSKARMKIDYKGYISLNNSLLEEYYNYDYKTYKGYRLLSVDGSVIEVPHGKSIEREFGKINRNSTAINAAKSIVAYDLLNDLLIEPALERSDVSERLGALKLFDEIKSSGKQKQDIIIADRGFPSLEVFVKLKKMGYNFIIRYTGQQFLKETLRLVKSAKRDMEVTISLTSRKNNLAIKELLEQGVEEKIRLRILKIRLPNGKEEYLITSLLSKEKHKIEDFNYLYNLRWNEERFFNYQKNVLEIEKFSGKTVESIKQDYYSKVLVGNLHTLIVEDAQSELDEEVKEDKKLKYSNYKINKTISYGMLKKSVRKLLTTRNWHKEYNRLVKEAKRYKYAVIEGRSFERRKRGRLKYPNNSRRAN